LRVARIDQPARSLTGIDGTLERYGLLCSLMAKVEFQALGGIDTRDQEASEFGLFRWAILAFTGSWRGKEGIVNLKERALAGVLGGVAATLVLSGLRNGLTKIGLVFETAPMQVVDRVEELGLLGDLSQGGAALSDCRRPLRLRHGNRNSLRLLASGTG
jgi:hypothetical protein